MSDVFQAIHLLKKLPPSWDLWHESYQVNTITNPDFLSYQRLTEEIIRANNQQKLEGAPGKAGYHSHHKDKDKEKEKDKPKKRVHPLQAKRVY